MTDGEAVSADHQANQAWTVYNGLMIKLARGQTLQIEPETVQ